MTLQEFLHILAKNKKSNTKEREVIFLAAKEKKHFSAQGLFDFIQKKNSTLSRMSVFRTLSFFESIGILKKVSINEKRSVQYEINDVKNHHEHMICSICGKIIEFSDMKIHKKLQSFAKKENFLMENHEIIIKGICNTCRKEKL